MKRDLADYQARYAAQPYEKYQSGFRRRAVKKLLANRPGAVILEAGCGLESIFLHLDSFAEVVVLEPAAGFFDKARRDAKKAAGKNIAVINAALEDAPPAVKNRRFDFILAGSLLHEVSDPRAFLAAARGLCHAETVVHINVPNAGSFHRLLAVEMGLVKDARAPSPSNIEFQQHAVFDMESLRRAVEDAGFEAADSGAYALKPFTHAQMQKMIDGGILTPEMLDGLYALGKRLPALCSEIYINAKIRK
ncbi:MAG: class I SAM-dependent methyltransferase [Betaproteobacteria bacterium]|nr:class I SAM-dependent methyltransferase [Betaproteobacteria bacterium]